MSEALWIAVVPVAIASLLAAAIRRVRPAWSRRRGVVVAAAPLPLLAAAVAVVVIVSAATASDARCGVDACGMASMFATFLLAGAFVAFGLGAIAAAVVLRERRRR